MKSALFFAATCFVLAATSVESSRADFAGWVGVFPFVGGYDRKFEKPIVDKQSYRQTVVYTWTGGRAESVKITLLRDAELAKRYTKDGVKNLPVVPKEDKVDEFVAWDSGADGLMIVLGDDRLMKFEAPTWKFHKTDFVRFAQRFDLKACAKALERPPYTDSRRKVEAFRELRKGMSLRDVQAWVGNAEKDVGSGIHIMEYRLDDGSRVLIGFPDFNKLIYVKHEDKAGKVVDLVK